MDYRTLGRTGIKVSRLAFGTMSFGGDADEAESARMFAACRDAGINLFDCADVYSRGRAEEILGKLIAPCRDEVVLTTKGTLRMSGDPNGIGASRYHLVRACEASLKRLGTDRIDLYFVHRFDDQTDLEETLRALELLASQGKILHVGLSNFAAFQAQKAVGLSERLGLSRPVCVQPMYNLVKRQAEVEILPQALAEGLAVLPYSPLAAGLLTGKFGKNKQPSAARLLDVGAYRDRYAQGGLDDIADGFCAIADELGMHPATLAVAWVMKHPAVTSPLLGARNVEQLAPCLAAAGVSLSDADHARITALSPAPPSATDRAEEGGPHDMWTR